MPDLQGKGPCGKEAFLLEAFLVTFGAPKVTAPAAIERGRARFEPKKPERVTAPRISRPTAQAITLPAAWRLPAAAGYNQLLIGLGGTPFSNSLNYTVSQTVALQLMPATGWTGTEGNNKLGFNARPVGDYNGGAQGFEGAGVYAFFLNNTPPTNTNVEPLTFEVTPDQTAVYPFLLGASTRWSVRFVKDE